MMETLIIAALLYTVWRLLQWVGRTVREIFRILGVIVSTVAYVRHPPSQAERDRQAVERLLKEVACPTQK